MPATSILARRTAGFISTDAAPFIIGSVLDAGCGAKPYKRMFPECEWTGLDARPVGDLEADFDTHVEVATRDTVLCTDSLQFSRDPAKAIGNMAVALKPGGHLVISVPNCWHEDRISRWRFTVGGLGEMVTLAGLEILYLDGLGGLFDELADDYQNSFDISATFPPEFRGWVNHLDATYPMLSACIAVKK